MKDFSRVDKKSNLNLAIAFMISVVAGLVLPLFLIPVVRVLGNSEIIEEFAKVIIIFLTISRVSGTRTKIMVAAIFGFIFGLSESVFYLSSFLGDGSFIFWRRLITVTPMHVVTSVVLALGVRINLITCAVGFVVSLLIHIIFNLTLFKVGV